MTKPEHAGLTPFLRRYSLLVIGLSSVMTVGAFGLSAWYFLGFLEIDRGIAHLLSAALMCFGVGALFYLPAYWIARRAYRVIKQPEESHVVIQPAFLVFPWLVFGFFLQALDGWWAYAGWFSWIMGALIIGWVWALRHRS